MEEPEGIKMNMFIVQNLGVIYAIVPLGNLVYDVWVTDICLGNIKYIYDINEDEMRWISNSSIKKPLVREIGEKIRRHFLIENFVSHIRLEWLKECSGEAEGILKDIPEAKLAQLITGFLKSKDLLEEPPEGTKLAFALSFEAQIMKTINIRSDISTKRSATKKQQEININLILKKMAFNKLKIIRNCVK